MGECYDYAKFTTYVMRSCGVPVSVDFTPQWPDRSGKHHWNVLFANSGKRLPFMGCESNPGSLEKYGRKMAKVYRITYAYQYNSLLEKNKIYKELIPASLASPFYIDVSEEYFVGKDVHFRIPQKQYRNHFIYLSVFDNCKWVPVDYAEVTNENVSFYKMGTDIVYMPVYWTKTGTIPIGSPFILLSDGTKKTLNANHKVRRSRGYYGVKQSHNKSKKTHVIPLIYKHFFDLISFISLTVKNLFLVHFCCTFVTRNKIIFITLTSEKPEWGHKIETNKSI